MGTAASPDYFMMFACPGSPPPATRPVGYDGPLPKLTLFLTSERSINVPLDGTFDAAWRGVLNRWKKVFEAET
jgi:hypothetical protein